MDAPDEALVEAVTRARVAAYAGGAEPKGPIPERWLEGTRSVLSVPGIADALDRDAKVAEIVADFPYGATDSQMVAMAEEVLDAHRWTAP